MPMKHRPDEMEKIQNAHSQVTWVVIIAVMEKPMQIPVVEQVSKIDIQVDLSRSVVKASLQTGP